MKRVERIHRGRVDVVAEIIDVPALGDALARARVLEAFSEGDRLLALADGRWLLVARTADRRHTATLDGVALATGAAAASATSAPAVAERPGVFVELRSGVEIAHDVERLPIVDVSGWFDLGVRISLDAARRVQAVVAIEEVSAETVPTRRRFRVGAPDAVANRMIRELVGPADGRRKKTAGRETRRVGSQRRPNRLRDALVRTTLRTPMAKTLGRRHTKYIEELTRRFATRDFDEALRQAVPAGGRRSHGGRLSLRLPARRESLQWTTGGQSRTVPWGESVGGHLSAVYRDAARELEELGDIDKAAFVWIELVGQYEMGAALLERHGRFRDAAEVTEQFELPAPDAVRRWWRAGERGRAVDLARAHLVFDVVVSRLDSIDADLAVALRREWSRSLQASGDPLGAIEVLWVDERLRADAVELTASLPDDDGPVAGGVLAYRLALADDTDDTDDTTTAVGLVESDDPEQRGRRDSFIATFLDVHAASPATDRRLASTIMRTSIAHPERRLLERRKDVLSRVDPILKADLVPEVPNREHRGTVLLSELAPGRVPVTDAVGLARGGFLAALGSRGVRLCGTAGLEVAQWPTPTSEIVLADNGNVALLVHRFDEFVDVRRLDLTTRQITQYGVLHLARWTDTFDGQFWLVIDERGAALLDMLAATPTIAYRPVESESEAVAVARTGRDQPSGLVVRAGRLELRTWTPDLRRLADRQIFESARPGDVARLGPGVALMAGQDASGHAWLVPPQDNDIPVDVRLGEPDLSGRFVSSLGGIGGPFVVESFRGPRHRIENPEVSVSFRWACDRITQWSKDGRIWIVEPATGDVLTAARIT